MSGVRDRGYCFCFFNSPTDEVQWEGPVGRREEGRKIFQGEIIFPGFLLFTKPAKGKKRFPFFLPKMELLQ